jgi:hypothetical protein
VPNVKVLYWNLQNFGDQNGFRALQSRVNFVAATVNAYRPDILFIMELKQNGIAGPYLQTLQEALNTQPAPFNNWYYDWIKGSLWNNGAPPAPTDPFATSADLAWDAAHNEGYAVFWNQNIAKFTMQPAPPIQPPTAGAAVANTQSESCRIQGRYNFGGANWAPLYGIAAGAIAVPGGGTPFIVPLGTNIPGHGIVGVDTPTAAGTVLPVNTVVGPGGIRLNAQTANVNPVVVPGGFTLTDALTLPALGSVAPANALGLVMFGRDSADRAVNPNRPDRYNGDISDNTLNFNPGGANVWNWIEFTGSAAGSAQRTRSRRPAYVTIKVNRPGLLNPADQLTPILCYHAPSASPASSGGMQRAAYSQPMYQAYDWTANGGAGGWINCNNALIGGDFNVPIDDVFYAYDAFTDAFGAANAYGGGAGATMAIANPAPPGGDMADNPLNKTICTLTVGIAGPPLYSAQINDFRVQAIDNIFYRGLGAIQAADTLALDMITACSRVNNVNGPLTGGPVTQCLNTPNMVNVQTAVYVQHVPPAAPNMISPTVSLYEMNPGQFATQPNFDAHNTGARRAAEFVNLFVSDHLPVAISFNM